MPKRVSTGYCVSVYNKMELKTFSLRGLQKKRFETTLPVRTKQIYVQNRTGLPTISRRLIINLDPDQYIKNCSSPKFHLMLPW